MRTSVDIDAELLRALLERHPRGSKREAVEHAIRVYLTRDAAARARALAGSVDVEDRSAELRHISPQPWDDPNAS